MTPLEVAEQAQERRRRSLELTHFLSLGEVAMVAVSPLY